MDDVDEPWYRNRANALPFKMHKRISSRDPNAPALHALAFFPWTVQSLNTLWNGNLYSEEALVEWTKMISVYKDAVAVCSEDSMYIIFTQQKKDSISAKLPPYDPNHRLLPSDSVHVAWTASHYAPYEPLILFSRGSILYIFNPNSKNPGVCSYLRGHGGAITSIAVHPTNVHLVCTTSRDFTARIYDVTLPPTQNLNNPHWPPMIRPSLAGPAHGLHTTEPEGTGTGRCIIVLMSGSGGHQAAVLGAAFHPHLPIIATCGMDRAVKIWFVHTKSAEQITREDKPLFSSGKIHRARVLSVAWLQSDILLSHCAPSTMHLYPDDPNEKTLFLTPVQLTVWRWLSMDRFFPPGAEQQEVLRGCTSDYQESSSFKIISTTCFRRNSTVSEFEVPALDVFQTPNHDPIVLATFPGDTKVVVINAADLPPRTPLPFPFTGRRRWDTANSNVNLTASTAVDRNSLVGATLNMHIGEGVKQEESEEEYAARVARFLKETERTFPPEPTGWEMSVKSDPSESSCIHRCAMGIDGRVIVAVGTKSTIWIWNREDM